MKHIFTCFLTLFFSQLFCQNTDLKPYNKAIIWRGFNHLWSYNHRVNRLGSFVFLDSNQVSKGVHCSASGLGSDSTYYEQYYTKVESPHLRFYQGSTTIVVTGRETQLLSDNKEIACVVPPWFQNLSRYKSIINGFEIKSIEKSDLPILFEMHVDDPQYSSHSREVKFKTNINWVANCRSAECPIFSNTTNYEITLHYLLIGWENSDALAFEFHNKKSYEWTVDEEKQFEGEKKMYQVQIDKYENVFLGIKSFGFILNEEQWIQELTYKASIENYFKQEGKLNADIGMLILGWKEGMKKQAVAKRQAMFSHKKPGWVSMTMNTTIIQTNNSKVIDGESSGTMFWRGKNIKADLPQSESIQILKFKF